MDNVEVKIAFEEGIVVVPFEAILPLKQVSEETKKLVRYKRVAQSIAEVGLIEPLVVSRQPDENGKHLLLDGHWRRAALLDRGETSARCILAHDDETFTYNKRINHLATIQEYFMIVRALARGVSEEKLAKALDVNIGHIKRRRAMLDGISPEVIEMLKDKMVSTVTFDALRRMGSMRQVEVAELMLSASNFTIGYARALLAATKQADLAKPERVKRIDGMTPEQIARMEREMSVLQQDFKAVETSYGEDVLHLVIACGYVSKLIGNKKVERYLDQNHPEILEEFKSIVSVTSLDNPVPEAVAH
ncbi:plasmid partitioning protein RepB C-terminal domain-containing protein [Bradyrhizobium diversitatis]|uniref:ParB N-terminal domain-containing protein n=1 Tax=Bradyrhizobium diversitatis TaxID=2755406 RepID=A0ABS0NVK9_9BRAD|nr:plasmid partitioning protein RepB C-terminal domain-containing protein [Bradyrhizobium diversitatis]MBH5385042.1 ParB N-terminal domain-containing protein [Bradyrhizobium diversitatis]